MEENHAPESLHEYCLQLGLQVRGNDKSTKMETACLTAADEETGQAPGHPLDATTPKTVLGRTGSHDCSNCGKGFASSRQFQKHKCSSKATPDSPPRPRVTRQSKNRRGRPAKVVASKKDQQVSEPTVEEPPMSKKEAQVDEESQSNQSGDHLADHTYNRDDFNGEGVEGSSDQIHAENSVKMAEKQHVRCELCSMFPETVSGNGSPQNEDCEKCKELQLASSLDKDSASVSLEVEISSGKDSLSEKKRKYVFKKPEDFCPHCNKGFHSEKRLAKHLKLCGKNLVCEFCGEDFNDGGQHAHSKYEQHYYTHVVEKPFKCNVCGKGFVRKPDLDKHKVIHTNEYVSQTCLQCGAVFSSFKLLYKHMKKHDRPSWDCPKCKKQFVRQVLFEKHVLSCQKEVSCEVCGKIFQCLSKNVKSRYQEHMFIHTGQKPYKCQFCERAFRDRSTRKKHERSHTGERPYPCTLCDRAFSQLRLLRNHVRTHTGEKPFACNLCNLSFAKQCNLKYHMRVHTKEKPYNCKLCNKSFTQSGTYHKHMRRHQSKQVPSKVPVVTATNENTDKEENEKSTSEAIPEIENSENAQVIQEIAMPSDEITIIVNEGHISEDGTTTTLTTIDVEQISNILVSCSQPEPGV